MIRGNPNTRAELELDRKLLSSDSSYAKHRIFALALNLFGVAVSTLRKDSAGYTASFLTMSGAAWGDRAESLERMAQNSASDDLKNNLLATQHEEEEECLD